MKFTPGPWEIIFEFNVQKTGAKRGICSCGGYQNNREDSYDENIANAHLIAAAPDMYEALRKAFNLKCDVPDCRRNNKGALNLNFCHMHNVIYKALDKVGDVEDYD
jgi:hypothetical protein